MSSIYNPFTYLIGWSKQHMFYYGVRWKGGCVPSDLWRKYFTSSKHVRAFREAYGEPDIVVIRKVFNDGAEARAWEHRVLRRLNAAARADFLNKTNGKCPSRLGVAHSATAKAKMSAHSRAGQGAGRKLSAAHRAAIAKGIQGKVFISAEQRAAIRKSNSTRAISDETRAKIAAYVKPESVRRAVSHSNATRVVSLETRAKMAASAARRLSVS